VADIDNDKELEVVIGDNDGKVWCFNAGNVGISGQTDWPMFQHNSQNTGVYPTKKMSFNISMELLDGDGPDDHTCYSEYKSYTFRTIVKDGMSSEDLDEVILTFDPEGENIQCKWTRETNEFVVMNDPDNLVQLVSDVSSATTDRINTWTIDFIVYFSWTFENTRPFSVSLKTIGQVNPSRSVYFKNYIKVEGELDFIGDLIVDSEFQGELNPGDWVRGGEKVNWSGLTVVYKNTEDVYPDVNKYSVIITDNKDNSWSYNLTTAGEPIDIVLKTPKVTDSEREFYLKIIPKPEHLEPVEVKNEFKLRIDSTNPEPPTDVVIHADSFSDSNTIADNDTTIFVTWTSPEQKFSGIYGYYYSTVDNGGTTDVNFTLDNSIKLFITQKGTNHFYIWSVDKVGNIGKANNASIIIDFQEVTFSELYPGPEQWINIPNINVGVTISDANGIGVDPATIQYSIKSPDDVLFGPWLSINQETDLTSLPGVAVKIDTPVLLTASGANLVRWRCKDLAGNGFTLSETMTIFVDDDVPELLNATMGNAGADDLRWVECNIKIKDVGGSGVNASSIEYKYSTNGINNYSNWIPLDEKIDGQEIDAVVVLFFDYGNSNYIKWRAKDVANNEYAESKDMQIRVDEPPVIVIYNPLNNSKHFIDDIITFDASPSYDPDSSGALEFYWISVYTNTLGQQSTNRLGDEAILKQKLNPGLNFATVYVNDGLYNVSKSVYLFVYDQFIDLDKDGMGDWWEMQYVGLDPENPGDAYLDRDGDGTTNVEEFIGGTNPADPDLFPGSDKKESKESEGPISDYLLINIIILVIIIVLLTVAFAVKRAKIKKARFKELQESSPALLRRRETTDGLSLGAKAGGTPQLVPQVIKRTPTDSQMGITATPRQVPEQEAIPQLPPHQPTAQDTTSQEPSSTPTTQPQTLKPPQSPQQPQQQTQQQQPTTPTQKPATTQTTNMPQPQQQTKTPPNQTPPSQVGSTPDPNKKQVNQGGDY